MSPISRKNRWILHNDKSYVGEWLIMESIEDIPEKARQVLQNLREFGRAIYLSISLLTGDDYRSCRQVTLKRFVNIKGYSSDEAKGEIIKSQLGIPSQNKKLFIQLSISLNARLTFYSSENELITNLYPSAHDLSEYIKENNNDETVTSLFSPIKISIYPDEARFYTYSNIWIPGLLQSEGNEELALVNGPRLAQALHLFESTFTSKFVNWQSGLYKIDHYGFPGGYDQTSDFGKARDNWLKEQIIKRQERYNKKRQSIYNSTNSFPTWMWGN